jgi:hypothetical protein
VVRPRIIIVIRENVGKRGENCRGPRQEMHNEREENWKEKNEKGQRKTIQ